MNGPRSEICGYMLGRSRNVAFLGAASGRTYHWLLVVVAEGGVVLGPRTGLSSTMRCVSRALKPRF